MEGLLSMDDTVALTVRGDDGGLCDDNLLALFIRDGSLPKREYEGGIVKLFVFL